MDLPIDVFAWVEDYGLAALFALTLLENLNLPLPSEPLLVFAGYMAWKGTHSPLTIFVVCLAGTMLGCAGSYMIGRFGRKAILEPHGRWFGATPERLDMTTTWMNTHGHHAVVWARCVPLVRTGISVAAGVAHMPFARFMAWSALGTGAWIIFLMTCGYLLGESWHVVEDYVGPAKKLVLGTFIVVVGVLIFFAVRRRRNAAPPADKHD